MHIIPPPLYHAHDLYVLNPVIMSINKKYNILNSYNAQEKNDAIALFERLTKTQVDSCKFLNFVSFYAVKENFVFICQKKLIMKVFKFHFQNLRFTKTGYIH